MIKSSRFAPIAFALCTPLFFSCTSDNETSQTYTYCIYETFCAEGPFTTCQVNGVLSNTCPYSSSSYVVPSSSSVIPIVPSSSSIALPSSSSLVPNAPSSSSVPPASSSSVVPVVPSSSSIALPSSSSLVPSAPSSSSVPPASSSSVVPVVPSSSSIALPSSSSLVPSVPSSSSVPPQTGVIPGPSVSYGGDTYETVVIGEQTWFKRNLNYAVEGSKCYGEGGLVYDDDVGGYKTLSDAEIQSNCAAYGRLYYWSTAMALPGCGYGTSCASQIGAKHRGICPSGWHIPSNADWDKLYRYADGSTGTDSPYSSPTAGTKLKSSSGWNSYSGGVPAGTDNYGFSALPGGLGYSDGVFGYVGYYGDWWSASEYSSYLAYSRDMYYTNEGALWYSYYKSKLFSVRCLQD